MKENLRQTQHMSIAMTSFALEEFAPEEFFLGGGGQIWDYEYPSKNSKNVEFDCIIWTRSLTNAIIIIAFHGVERKPNFGLRVSRSW